MRTPPGLPRKVWIGPLEFRLQLVPRAHAELAPDAEDLAEDPETAPHDGITVFDRHAIFIADDMSLSGLLETVLHELSHAVNHVAGIDDGAIEEDIAAGHGKVWAPLWIANPRLQRWLTGVLNAIRKDQASA